MGTLIERDRAFLLLLKNPANLSDEELERLISHVRELDIYLRALLVEALPGIEVEKRYRARRKELEKLSTEELVERARRNAEAERMARWREIEEDDDYDPRPDSGPSPAQKDSETYIVAEILRERGVGW